MVVTEEQSTKCTRDMGVQTICEIKRVTLIEDNQHVLLKNIDQSVIANVTWDDLIWLIFFIHGVHAA